MIAGWLVVIALVVLWNIIGPAGVLLLLGGGIVYSIGAVILDRDDPSKVLHRCANFLLAPEKIYETAGYVPNVLFPVSCLTDAKTGRIAIYAGGADTVTELLFTDIDTVIDYILKHER